MTVRAAQKLLQQICYSAGSQTQMSDLARVAGPGFCSLLTMTISTIQAAFTDIEDTAASVAQATADADLEVVQEAAWEKMHTGCWKDVEPAWRDAYALACLLRALVRLSRPHVTPPAVSKPPCRAAASESPPRMSDRASLSKHPQQLGEQVVISGIITDAEERPLELEGLTAQPLTTGTQERTGTLRCGGIPREGSGMIGDALTSSEQHTEVQEGSAMPLAACAIQAAMRELDLGIMMGGRTHQERLHAAIAIAQRAWADRIEAGMRCGDSARHLDSGCAQLEHKQTVRGKKRNRSMREEGSGDGSFSSSGKEMTRSTMPQIDQVSKAAAAWAPAELSAWKLSKLQKQLPPGSLGGQEVSSEHLPSLDHFLELYMCSAPCGQPCRMTGCMTHWPALDRWQHPEYLLAVAGQRTVPIELGKHYLEEGWGQSLISLGTFLRRHVMQADNAGGEDESGQAALAAKAAQAVGYLAQHPLFEQIPELARDIREPEYCSLGAGALHSVNAWFGPGGTVTPLHHDPHHNVLAQVVGLKYIRLYPPSATPRLYPFPEGLTTNASQVDLAAPDLNRYPDFEGLPHQDTLLRPGDMLYIPPGWWHYVQSLSVSFSVSFWWS